MLTNFESIKEKQDNRPVRNIDPRYVAGLVAPADPALLRRASQ